MTQTTCSNFSLVSFRRREIFLTFSFLFDWKTKEVHVLGFDWLWDFEFWFCKFTENSIFHLKHKMKTSEHFLSAWNKNRIGNIAKKNVLSKNERITIYRFRLKRIKKLLDTWSVLRKSHIISNPGKLQSRQTLRKWLFLLWKFIEKILTILIKNEKI